MDLVGDDIVETLVAEGIAFDDPAFFAASHRAIVQQFSQNTLLPAEAAVLNDYEALSRHVELSGIQDPAAVRNQVRARDLATFLIDRQGHLDDQRLTEVITVLKRSRKVNGLSVDGHTTALVRSGEMEFVGQIKGAAALGHVHRWTVFHPYLHRVTISK